MAIVSISRIQHRRGYRENLPQLSHAEFGWATDQRKLYIGNGPLIDGAPVVGNTEILTEFSDLSQHIDSTQIRKTLVNNTSTPTTTGIVLIISSNEVVTLKYRIDRGANTRFGILTVSANTNSSKIHSDEYDEIGSGGVGVTLSAAVTSSKLTIVYTTTATGGDASLTAVKYTYQ